MISWTTYTVRSKRPGKPWRIMLRYRGYNPTEVRIALACAKSMVRKLRQTSAIQWAVFCGPRKVF